MPIETLKRTLAPLALRAGLAAIMLYHGLLKVLYRGGGAWSSDPDISPAVQEVVAWVELLSGVAIALGLGTRLAALAVAVIQVGAIILVTGPRGPVSLQRLGRETEGYRFGAVGWEYNFALIIMCLTLVLLGSGTWSLNNALLRWMRARRAAAGPDLPATTAPAPGAPTSSGVTPG